MRVVNWPKFDESKMITLLIKYHTKYIELEDSWVDLIHSRIKLGSIVDDHNYLKYFLQYGNFVDFDFNSQRFK